MSTGIDPSTGTLDPPSGTPGYQDPNPGSANPNNDGGSSGSGNNLTTPSGNNDSGSGGDGGIPLSGDNLTLNYTFLDPELMAILRDDYDTDKERGGIMWNSFFYGVPYDPTEEVWVDQDGNIVEDAQMLNPDYVPPSTEQVKNPAYEEYNRTYDTEGSEPYNPPPEYITQEVPGSGEQYINNPNITRTTRGAVEGYNADDVISEFDLIQMGTQAEGDLLPQRIISESARISADTATSNLATATAESQLRLLPEQEQNELLRIGAENAGYNLSTADAESQLRLLPVEEQTRLMMLGAEQSGYNLTTATNEMGLRLLPEQEQSLSAGYRASTAQSNLTAADANRAIALIEYGESVGLGEAEIDAQLAKAGYNKADADYAKELLNYRRETGVDTAGIDFEKQSIADKSLAMQQRAPVREAMYSQALKGLDTEKYARQSAADASSTYDASKQGLNTNLALRGVNPGELGGDDSMDRARIISGAKTQARNWAETESFNRLNAALNNAEV